MALAFSRPIAAGVARWTDSAAEVVVAGLGRAFRPRLVRLVEEDEGVFAVGVAGEAARERIQIGELSAARSVPPELAKLVKGSRVDLVLRPSRFVFRPLQLPGRASEFLEGIVRAQIDRLTPWSPADAVFGWRETETANDRVTLMIAVTARTMITPLVQFAAELGAASIAVLTTQADGEAAAAIKVFDQDAGGMLDVRRMSRMLLLVLTVCGAAAGLAFAADMVGGTYLDNEQLEASQRIFARRAAIRAGSDAQSRTALSQLERRKHETAASVIVLEVLSRVLPDHTYVTELRIEGSKVQIVGITRDAAGLIRLIEQSDNFTRATFFAPTTRAASDTGEQFHIEAQIKPVNNPRT